MRCLVACFIVWVAHAAAAAARDAVDDDRPNVVLFMSDDMGWGDVSFYEQYQAQPGAGGKTWTPNFPLTPNLAAMAAADSSITFTHFLSGSAVCSPTRSSCLTGRTPNRECIFSAEGCGGKRAYECDAKYPLPPPTFTLAEAAKQLGMATTHIGKWHLGNLFPIGNTTAHPNYASQQWPASHPGMHGFDEWTSTIASASSSTTNCGCDPAWKDQGQGCIVGGGKWVNHALSCTNYWSPTDLNSKHEPTRPACHNATTTTFDCLTNLTTKITGDDTKFMLDTFEDFLKRKTGPEKSKFFAVLWDHTNHVPHPALPEYYSPVAPIPADKGGDYLGTIRQMDVQIGRLRAMLRQYGVANNTILMYTADNGPHTSTEATGRDSVQAANGLRQCKASLFEGGLRVPGIIEWPDAIKGNRVSHLPVVTHDYMPTVLEAWGMPYPNPSWPLDGVSILAVLKGKDMDSRPPIGFALGDQRAWLARDNATRAWMKLVVKPEQGQCRTFLPPYGHMKDRSGPFLFNLTADPTESHDLAAANPRLTASMAAALAAWDASVARSQVVESRCEPPPPSGQALKATALASCLHVDGSGQHAAVAAGDCDAAANVWVVNADGQVATADGRCLKVQQDGVPHPCDAGNTFWMGACQSSNAATMSTAADGTLCSTLCTGSCVEVVPADGSVVDAPAANATRFELVAV